MEHFGLAYLIWGIGAVIVTLGVLKGGGGS